MASILVIDDQQIVRDSYKDALEESGHTVITAADGAEALSFCENTRFDVVITDVCMPRKEGVSVVRAVKSQYEKTRIIVISGAEKRSHYLETAKAFGADLTLEKPVNLEKLRCYVDEMK